MKPMRGFSLIELVVVVAIVGILAAVAIPAYNEQVRKGRRADAIRAIGQLQLELERWRSDNPSYANCGGPGCGNGNYPVPPQSDYYTLSIPAAEPVSYTIRATPKGAQSNDNCGNLELVYNTGTVTKTPATTSCWN